MASDEISFARALGEAVEAKRIEAVEAGERFDRRTFFVEIARSVDAHFRDVLLKDVTVDFLKQYRLARLKYVTPSSVNKNFQVIRAALRVAVAKGWIPSNPAAELKDLVESAEIRRRYVRPSEFARLAVACMESENPDLWDLVQIFVNTGMDKSEVLQLRKEQAWFDEGLIKLSKFKTRSPRDIAMNKVVTEILLRRACDVEGDYFFICGQTGQPYKNFKRSFKSACDKAGLKLRIKDLRHTFATGLVSAGVPILEISHLLGHKNPRTTMIYAKLTPERNLEAVTALEGVFSGKGGET